MCGCLKKLEQIDKNITECDRCKLKVLNVFIIIPFILLLVGYSNYDGYDCPPKSTYINKEECCNKSSNTRIKRVYYEDKHNLGVSLVISGIVIIVLWIIITIFAWTKTICNIPTKVAVSNGSIV